MHGDILKLEPEALTLAEGQEAFMPENNNRKTPVPDAASLRFGYIAELYYGIHGEKKPKQLDQMDTWFPGLIVVTDASDGETKREAEYVDLEYVIHAVRYRGKFYSGGSTRISQICGRLTGTAEGNKEKERKTAELIQKHVAECFMKDMTLAPRLQENAALLLDQLTEDEQEKMYDALTQLIWDLAGAREEMPDYDRKTEPFAMDDETFDGTIYNAAYQLNLASFSGFCNAYLWLLTGSLLRNEVGRVLRLYDSAFIAIRRQMSVDGTLKDKLNNLIHPEAYEYTFDGDDLENRFPGVEWYCDKCDAHLNEQEGFDDHLPEWKCTACGYVNPISIEEIYDNDEDWRNGIRAVDAEKFADAVRRRKEEKQSEMHK